MTATTPGHGIGNGDHGFCSRLSRLIVVLGFAVHDKLIT